MSGVNGLRYAEISYPDIERVMILVGQKNVLFSVPSQRDSTGNEK